MKLLTKSYLSLKKKCFQWIFSLANFSLFLNNISRDSTTLNIKLCINILNKSVKRYNKKKVIIRLVHRIQLSKVSLN